MLRRSQRLRGGADIQQVFRRGRRARSDVLTVLALLDDRPEPQCAIAVSKKVSKKAIRRNRMRRKIFSILKQHYACLHSGAYVVVVSRDVVDMPPRVLDQQVRSCLEQMKALHCDEDTRNPEITRKG